MSAVLHKALGPAIQIAPAVMTVVATALSFLVVTLLTVVLSELLPKALTLRHAESAAVLTAVPVLGIQRGLRPLVWLMNAMANAVTRPLGLGTVDETEVQRVTAEELRLMATQAAADGVLTPRERSMILNTLTFGRRPAREIMVPRVRVQYLDLHWSMERNREVLNQYLHSRLPVCDGGLDHVVGVLHTKEFLAAYSGEGEGLHGSGDSQVLALLAKPPVFVPENVSLDRLLGAFHEHKTQLVFLVDEYGGVEGIVTLQDVVDEIVGEIRERAPDAGPAVLPRRPGAERA
jgi:CBS domain containing-hemolysin-like protein